MKAIAVRRVVTTGAIILIGLIGFRGAWAQIGQSSAGKKAQDKMKAQYSGP